MLILVCLKAVLVFSQITPSQKKKIDSLKYVINTTKDDSLKVNALMLWDYMIYLSDPELDYELNVQIAQVCLQNLNKDLSTSRRAYFKKELSFAYNNIGIYFQNLGDYLRSLDYFEKNLELSLEIDNQRGIVNSYNNMGNSYKYLDDTLKALEYYEKSLFIWEKLEDPFGKGTTLNNIGIIYNERSDFKRAGEYFDEALTIFEELDDAQGIGMVKYNQAQMHIYQNEHKKALKLLEEGKEANDRIGYLAREVSLLAMMAEMKVFIADSLKEKGRFDLAKPLYVHAIEMAQQAFEIGVETEMNQDIPFALEALHKAQRGLGNYREAYSSLKDFHSYSFKKDSLLRSEEYLKNKFQFEYETQALKDSISFAEQQKVSAARLEKEKTQKYALYGGVFLLLLFGGFIYSRFKKSQAQKALIEEQKSLVEEQHKEIRDSIKYAQRIQSAILPPPHIVDKYLEDCIVIYLPKDVVAGDFYWLQHVNEKPLFAAADCTGHGVPGAMVSVVCNNALNRSVKEFGLTNPGKILDKTREIVIDEFARSEQNVKDGMDIALCYKNGYQLQFAGANNSFWLIRKGELIIYKGDKQPIGNYEHQKPFTTHELTLQEGDTFYMFSDGIVDQFGGEKGKKFKAKGLKELLLGSQDKSMQEQKKIIVETIEEWMGNHEQIDDICVIGVRV